MKKSDNTIKYVCIGLGVVVAILLLAIAFLLGRQSKTNKPDGAGRSSSGSVTLAGETAAATQPQVTEATSDQPQAPTESGDSAAPQSDDAQMPFTVLPPAGVTENIPKELDVEMTSGSLTFEIGAQFDVQYDSSVIRVETVGGAMTIENDHSNPTAGERKRMDVTVVVPEGYAFEDVDIEFGAGKLITRALRTGTLELEMGAGSATLEGLVATTSAEIRNGAGAFTIKSGSLNNLTMQCGAGATQVKAALTGSSRVVAAVGAVDIQLEGSESDYTVAFQMGLGACYYNNEKIARGGSFGSGPNRVDLSGGLGVMRVTVG